MPPQMSHTCGTSKPCQSAQTSELYIYIYIYIYTKFIVWCEGKERSIPLQVERKQSKHTRQRSDVATLSFNCQLPEDRQPA